MLALGLALLTEIKQEIQLRELVQDVDLWIAKASPELQLTHWRKFVVAKNEDLVTQKGFVNLVETLIAKFHPELHALDFCPNAGCQRPHNKVPAQVQ
jgi:hypothetical protein